MLDDAFLDSSRFNTSLETIIREGDPNVLTAGYIRRALEKDLNLDPHSLDEKPWKKIVNGKVDQTFARVTSENNKNNENEESTTKPDTPTTSPQIHNIELKDEQDAMEEDINFKEEQEFQSGNEEDHSEQQSSDDLGNSEKGVSRKAKRSSSVNAAQPLRKKAKQPTYELQKPNKGQSEAKGSSANDALIKRLKSYVLKCGVRKVWQKELADCPSAKAQITRLKSILEELGVKGRPTLEKCQMVKDERELRAEIDSLDTSNVINDTRKGPSLRSRQTSRKKLIIEESDEDDEDEAKESIELDVSFLGDQDSDSD